MNVVAWSEHLTPERCSDVGFQLCQHPPSAFRADAGTNRRERSLHDESDDLAGEH
jgi:hypothetical protein